jgi:hypothetical protein
VLADLPRFRCRFDSDWPKAIDSDYPDDRYRSYLCEPPSQHAYVRTRLPSEFNKTAWDKSGGSEAHSDITSPWFVFDHSLAWGEAYDMQIMQFGEPAKV